MSLQQILPWIPWVAFTALSATCLTFMLGSLFGDDIAAGNRLLGVLVSLTVWLIGLCVVLKP